MCGTKVGVSGGALSSDGPVDSSLAINVVRFEESKSSRSFEARFTDTAVDSLSGPIEAALSNRLSVLGHAVPRQTHAPDSAPLIEQLAFPTVGSSLGDASGVIDVTPRFIHSSAYIKDRADLPS